MFAFLKHLFKLQFLIILAAIFAGVYYPQILEKTIKYAGDWINRLHDPIDVYCKNTETGDAERLFSKAELATYNGENNAPIYLALLGSVYDVTKGSKHYGPGCSYNYFVGRDASVSFITGEFETYDEQDADDVNILKHSDLLSLSNWKNFYEKEYSYKGKLIGRFYDTNGEKTDYHYKFDALLDQAKTIKETGEQLRDTYPDCNIEWSAETGSRVWCTRTSGGKERTWVGYPRKLYELGSESYRCACVRAEDLQTTLVMIKPYENCEQMSDTCYYNVD